jgi:hypothetical protein
MNTEKLIIKINDLTSKFSFYEFSIYTYSKEKLIIVGSPDISYYHNLEIHFNDIFYIKSKFNWIVNTRISIVESLKETELIGFNKENEIEVGYNTIKFIDQDNLCHYFSFATIELIEEITKY